MHRNVELLIGRLATDADLLRRFSERPVDVVLQQGLELSPIELAALAGTDPGAFRTFADALDARLRKASLATDTRSASGEDPRDADPHTEKETLS